MYKLFGQESGTVEDKTRLVPSAGGRDTPRDTCGHRLEGHVPVRRGRLGDVH